MSQTPITVTYTLEQIFIKLDQRLDKIENKIDNLDAKFTAEINNLDAKFTAEINNLDAKFTAKIDNLDTKFAGKIDNLQKDVTEMNVRLTKVETKLEGVDSDVKELKTTQKNQIWSLIALSFTAVLGLIGAIFKILFFPNS